MLSYAFQTLNQGNYDDLAVESFDEMYDLLAAILAKGIGIQLKQGLYREYINRQEELPVMRGKINMSGTIKNRLAHELLLTCDFDELSENNLLNQILKTTVMLLLKNAKVKAEYKDDLKKKCCSFLMWICWSQHSSGGQLFDFNGTIRPIECWSAFVS